jgi:hypothetical protein
MFTVFFYSAKTKLCDLMSASSDISVTDETKLQKYASVISFTCTSTSKFAKCATDRVRFSAIIINLRGILKIL